MKDTVLVFLIKRNQDKKIFEILLSMKKKGFGVGKWHGVGGTANENEEFEQTAIRVSKEKIAMDLSNPKKVAEIHYEFPHEPDWNQFVHVFFAENFTGDPKESDEYLPMWFSLHNLPFDQMIDGDEHLLPHLIGDKLATGRFTFAKGEVLEDLKLDFVESF